MNLDFIYKEFINEKNSYCEIRTIEYYQENLSKFIQFVNDEAADGRPDKNIYIKYITHLRSSGIKNTSIRTYCRAIRAFSSWMNNNGYIDYDFTMNVKLPRPDNEIIMPLSEKEAFHIDEILISSETFTNLRNLLILHLMLDAGLRKSEVINIHIKDIDCDNRIIRINNSKYNKSRIIPMSNKIYNYYNTYISDLISFDIVPMNNLILKDDFTPITDSCIKNVFRKLKKTSGIERLHPHLLRHTFATSYLIQGGNLEQLRLFLGHSDYNVTRNYLHLAASNKLIGYDYYKLDTGIFN